MTIRALATELNLPDLVRLVGTFLSEDHSSDSLSNISTSGSEGFNPEQIACLTATIFLSTVATFHAPSDLSNRNGITKERIRATSSWRNEGPRYDCIYITTSSELEEHNISIGRVYRFLAIHHDDMTYPCAVIRWYTRVGNCPDDKTGMWVVKPGTRRNGMPFMAVIHLETVIRAVHLIPVYQHRTSGIPVGITPSQTLDAFPQFYVNKYIDHHAFELMF